jgi:hypothetical protein
LDEIGASLLPTRVKVEAGNGQEVAAEAYGIVITVEDIEAPSIRITFEDAQTLVGVEMFESLGSKLDPTTRTIEFTRPQGIAYFYVFLMQGLKMVETLFNIPVNEKLIWGYRFESRDFQTEQIFNYNKRKEYLLI